RQVRLQQGYSAVEAVADEGLQLRVVVPINLYTFSEDARMLQLLQPVPAQLAQDAETVQSIYRDYQELTLSRQGLKQLYGVTLTLALLLALLGAFALAFLLSERLSAPLGILAKGTRAVAQGDFSQQHTLPGRDELGVLTQSFNRMTQQLAEARAAAQRNQAQLETAKAYVESLLANLSAGVMSFDEAFRLRSENPSAGHLLHVDFSTLRGVELKAWPERSPRLEGLSRAILESFSRAEGAEWERQFEYADRAGNRVLLLRGTRLPGKQADHVVVFDDITHLLEAQRHAAWSEVARRLAHEIKNPLMPIQLSAERMQRKLTAKLEPADAEMLERSTQNIVTQVGALKSMVDAFSQYARSPGPSLQPLDLNRLVRDVLALYEAQGSPIKLELAPRLPQINGDPNQLRQVIHNLLQNAQDALIGQPKPAVTVRTAAAENSIQLSVIDNGSGFPEQLLTRVFEPYVTTKQKGTGLGLAIVKRIVEEHGGVVSISNLEPRGASVTLSLPLAVPQDAAKKSAVRA
ncbi:MAG: HAMP domain-containing protein, partial [Burkholderiales bacterium]|nr:HAMP domain-containing protein [Burkholderiales bacterium]